MAATRHIILLIVDEDPITTTPLTTTESTILALLAILAMKVYVVTSLGLTVLQSVRPSFVGGVFFLSRLTT